MAFRFVHTADWHIGKAFGSFEPDKAVLLRDARYGAVENIMAAARDADAKHVLVAGDIFDGPGLPDASLRKLLSLLAAATDLTWHLLPGNHDPDQPRGIWQRIAHIGAPVNVVIHRNASPFRLSEQAILLPAPLDQKRMSADPTAWFDDVERDPRDVVIGLAHGSTQGFGGQSETSILISPQRAAASGLDYLALGDWHGTTQVADKAWYCGTPEPEGYVDNDPGNILVVEIAGAGARPNITAVPTGKYNWQRHKVTCGALDNAAVITELLADAQNQAQRRLIRLDLEGEVTLAEEAQLRLLLDDAAPTFFHLDVRWRDLTVSTSNVESDVFEDDLVGAVAHRLLDQSNSGDQAQAAAARRALRLLTRLAMRSERPAQ